MQWDSDPIISQNIEIKRNQLAQLNLRRVKQRMMALNTSNKLLSVLKNIYAVLQGKTRRISMKMLTDLENVLHKIFDNRPVAFIEITSDDEDNNEPEFSPEPSPPLEISDEDSYEDQSDHGTSKSFSSSVTQTKACSTSAKANLPLSVPLPSQELPSASSLLASLPSQSSSEITNVSPRPTTSGVSMPPRRKSTSRPTTELPSIAAYKLKHQVFPSSSLYAKPMEQETERPARQIITVPYKTVPRNLEKLPYDPKAEAEKLAGIKEKIYARNYLRFENGKKEEMQKRFSKENAPVNENVTDQPEIEDFEPTYEKTPKRRKSVQPKAVQESALKNPQVSRNKKAREVPAKKSRTLAEIRKNRSKSVDCRKNAKKAPLPLRVQRKETNIDGQPSTSKELTTEKPTLAQVRMTRSKSVLLESLVQLKDSEDVDTVVQDNPKGQSEPETGRKSVSEVLQDHNQDKLVQSKDCEPSSQNLDSNSNVVSEIQNSNSDEDDNLLVEIPGVRKVPRRRTIYVPKRRNAVDFAVQQDEIKQEPVDALSVLPE